MAGEGEAGDLAGVGKEERLAGAADGEAEAIATEEGLATVGEGETGDLTGVGKEERLAGVRDGEAEAIATEEGLATAVGEEEADNFAEAGTELDRLFLLQAAIGTTKATTTARKCSFMRRGIEWRQFVLQKI